MAFTSVLFPENYTNRDTLDEAPDYFRDLNLDQIVDEIISDKRLEYLKRHYYTAIESAETIRYRQALFSDLKNSKILLDTLLNFAKSISYMDSGRIKICDALLSNIAYRCTYLEKSRLYSFVQNYCVKTREIFSYLEKNETSSEALNGFKEYLRNYISSEYFIELERSTSLLKAKFSQIRYTMSIKDSSIVVDKYKDEPDYSSKIKNLFEKFNYGSADDIHIEDQPADFAEHVEAGVLKLVATELYPGIFAELDSFCSKYKNFIDPVICLFAKEITFYTSYLGFAASLENKGLTFCIPAIDKDIKNIYANESFDVSLAKKLVRQGQQNKIVCNDFALYQNEKIIVVTGPNQAGKTTFARLFGQVFHLAAIGCPIPGTSASLSICDSIYTHFERQESLITLNGKLHNDLSRIHSILNTATARSVIVINEFLASTSLEDSLFIGKEIIQEISKLGSICVYVTFIDELSVCTENIVSMTGSVLPEDPTKRTYKITRNKADGIAYAMHIARKYRLTHELLMERIKL